MPTGNSRDYARLYDLLANCNAEIAELVDWQPPK